MTKPDKQNKQITKNSGKPREFDVGIRNLFSSVNLIEEDTKTN